MLLSCPHQPHVSRMCAVPPAPDGVTGGGRLGPAPADTTVGWTPCRVGSGDTKTMRPGSLPGGVPSLVDDRAHCPMTAWLPAGPGQRVTRGCGAGLTGRWESEGGSQRRWHRSSGIPHRKGRVPSAGGRGGSRLRGKEAGTEWGAAWLEQGLQEGSRLGLC